MNNVIVTEKILAEVVKIDNYGDGDVDVWFTYNGKFFPESYSSKSINFSTGDKVYVDVSEAKLRELIKPLKDAKTPEEKRKELSKYCNKEAPSNRGWCKTKYSKVGCSIGGCKGKNHDGTLKISPFDIESSYDDLIDLESRILAEDSIPVEGGINE